MFSNNYAIQTNDKVKKTQEKTKEIIKRKNITFIDINESMVKLFYNLFNNNIIN